MGVISHIDLLTTAFSTAIEKTNLLWIVFKS